MDAPRRGRDAAHLLLFLALCFGAAAGGALWPPGPEYAALQRPAFAPPNWLFGPVWTLLYLLIAVAGWRLWRRGGWASPALRLWLLQLALNALWTPLFFGLQWRGLALVEMSLLWASILACLLAARRRDRGAAWLLLPYLGWVGFAWALNAAFWWLNR
jgi:translocator protein